MLVTCAIGSKVNLYSFAGGPGDGDGPMAGLLMDSVGNLYGTTDGIAPEPGVVIDGPGSLYGVTRNGGTGGHTGTVLYSQAANLSETAEGVADLLLDSAGKLYGATVNGGTHNYGAVFLIN